MKPIKYLLQSVFIYLFFILCRLLGLSLSRKLSEFVFVNFGPLFKSKEIIKNNLKIFNKNLVIDEEKELTKKMWKNYGLTFIEYIFLNYFKKGNSHIVIKGEEKLDKIINQGYPVIFVSGHFANFELMSMEITKKGISLATIYRPLNNYFLNPLMENLRKKYVCKNQIKKGLNGVREAIDYLKKNYSIALMIDQRVSEGERINLFSKPALTTTLPAQLAIKYKINIVPVYIERNNKNKFKVEIYDEVKSSNFKTKLELSENLNQILEEMIKKNPSQWIWTHNRWK